jgi:hypothetical protein
MTNIKTTHDLFSDNLQMAAELDKRRDMIQRQATEIDRLRDSNMLLEERIRLANVVADLAIKHREMTEASNAELLASLEETVAGYIDTQYFVPEIVERARAAIAAAKEVS